MNKEDNKEDNNISIKEKIDIESSPEQELKSFDFDKELKELLERNSEILTALSKK
jgi:hypothetical protein